MIYAHYSAYKLTARQPGLCTDSSLIRKVPSAASVTSARSPLTLQHAVKVKHWFYCELNSNIVPHNSKLLKLALHIC